MNQQEYEMLQDIGEELISASDLVNKTPRTLLYGYTLDRDSWHVYLDHNSEIKAVRYGYRDDAPIHLINIKWNDDYIPSKRLYAEKCDFEFCKILKLKDISLNFTTTNFENISDAPYHGRILK